MNRKHSPFTSQKNEFWNKLLRILMRAVHVVPSCNDARQLVRSVIGLIKTKERQQKHLRQLK